MSKFYCSCNGMHTLYIEVNYRHVINASHLFILSLFTQKLFSQNLTVLPKISETQKTCIFISATFKLSLRFTNPWHYSLRLIILTCLLNLLERQMWEICRLELVSFTLILHAYLIILFAIRASHDLSMHWRVSFIVTHYRHSIFIQYILIFIIFGHVYSGGVFSLTVW